MLDGKFVARLKSRVRQPGVITLPVYIAPEWPRYYNSAAAYDTPVIRESFRNAAVFTAFRAHVRLPAGITAGEYFSCTVVSSSRRRLAPVSSQLKSTAAGEYGRSAIEIRPPPRWNSGISQKVFEG